MGGTPILPLVGPERGKIEQSGAPFAIPQLVTFKFDGVTPPSPLYVQRDDNFALTIGLSTVFPFTVNLFLRILRTDGVIIPINRQFTNTAPGSTNFLFEGVEGFLLSAVAIPGPGNFQRGQVWVRLVMNRGTILGTNLGQLLISNYLSPVGIAGWPGGALILPVDGIGAARVIVGTTPALGAEINEVVPTSARWRLIALRTILTTSAAVATRTPRFFFDDGTNVYMESQNNAGVTQNQAVPHSLWPGNSYASGGGIISEFPAPTANYLRTGFRIRTSTSNLQPGDQWSAPIYEVEEWIDL